MKWQKAVAAAKLPATGYRVAMLISAAAVHGTFWQSKRTVAEALNCDEARLVPAFRSLIAQGFMYKVGEHGCAGKATNEYRLAISPAKAAPPAESAPPAEVATAPPAESAIDPLRKAHPKDSKEERNKRGGLKNQPPSGSALPPAEAVGAPDNAETTAKLRLLRSLGASMAMGTQSIETEWNPLVEAISEADIPAICARVNGALTPRHFATAARACNRKPDDIAPKAPNVRGWLTKQTGVTWTRECATNAELTKWLSVYGDRALIDMTRHAIQYNLPVAKALAKEWYKGRSNGDGGWDVYRPKEKLPSRLNEVQVQDILDGSTVDELQCRQGAAAATEAEDKMPIVISSQARH